MEKILKYFPNITPEQKRQLEMLGPLYEDWNAKINVISRKDISNLYEHHVLHSLAIAQEMRFRPGTRILDFGTGGGFPGIPRPSCFPRRVSNSLTVRRKRYGSRRRWHRPLVSAMSRPFN